MDIKIADCQKLPDQIKQLKKNQTERKKLAQQITALHVQKKEFINEINLLHSSTNFIKKKITTTFNIDQEQLETLITEKDNKLYNALRLDMSLKWTIELQSVIFILHSLHNTYTI